MCIIQFSLVFTAYRRPATIDLSLLMLMYDPLTLMIDLNIFSNQSLPLVRRRKKGKHGEKKKDRQKKKGRQP